MTARHALSAMCVLLMAPAPAPLRTQCARTTSPAPPTHAAPATPLLTPLGAPSHMTTPRAQTTLHARTMSAWADAIRQHSALRRVTPSTLAVDTPTLQTRTTRASMSNPPPPLSKIQHALTPLP